MPRVALRWETDFSFRAQTCLKLLGFKRSCVNYARLIHIMSFPQEDGFFYRSEDDGEHLQASFQLYTTWYRNQRQANISWKDAHAIVLAV